MDEVKIKLASIQDVGLLSEIALRNGYKVTSEPVYEPFWKTKIDHFEVNSCRTAERERVNMRTLSFEEAVKELNRIHEIIVDSKVLSGWNTWFNRFNEREICFTNGYCEHPNSVVLTTIPIGKRDIPILVICKDEDVRDVAGWLLFPEMFIDITDLRVIVDNVIEVVDRCADYSFEHKDALDNRRKKNDRST